MELNEVKKLVEYFEDRIINKFDEHFNYLVLEDFYSSGGDVGRLNDEWFYEEYFSRYEEDIIELLNDINFDDENYFDFQLRLIKLKRIIDTKISKVKKDDNVGIPARKSRSTSFIINPKIDNHKFIKSLYKSLKSNNFISDSEEQFNLIFNDKFYPNDKIHWKGTELEITTLFNSIIENNCFDEEIKKFKFKSISKYFTNKKGNDFRPSQLNSVYHEKKDMILDDNPIFKVISEMSTYY